MESPNCPTFIKAETERVKKRHDKSNKDDDGDCITDDETDQPDWIRAMRPSSECIGDTDELEFDDGGPSHKWDVLKRNYPSDFGKEFVQNLSKIQIPDSSCTDIDILSLNTDQKLAFNIIMDSLVMYKSGISCAPLRIIISGSAGSGKTYLIRSIVQFITSLFGSKTAAKVLCPTGNSANLLSGTTIHSFLKIPTSVKVTKDMSVPNGAMGIQLQENCQGLVALLVDERSMVGCMTLGWMEFHCRYALNSTNISWGGLPVVAFLGDDVQLPPVCDSPVYYCSSKIPAALHGAIVWKEFDTVVHLQSVVRQNSDQQLFKNVLTSLKNYSLSGKMFTTLSMEFYEKYPWAI